jgi:hypothetical protein
MYYFDACLDVIAIMFTMSFTEQRARQIVDRGRHALKYRSNSFSAGQSLNEFIADVSSLQAWEHQHICLTGNFTSRCLALSDSFHKGGITCNSPSIIREGSIFLAILVADTTLSTNSCLALPLVENST